MTQLDSDLDNTCIDVYPEGEEPPIGTPAEAALELALPTNKLWDSGRTLDFHFLDGTDEQKAIFRNNAAEWAQFANLKMRFDQPASSAEFRVAFTRNKGNNSFVGTDNLRIPTTRETMNIKNMDSIKHEVGHALGCVHEHSSPASGINWNKPVVYNALAKPPNNWDKNRVDHNVFKKYDGTQTQFSSFDRDSIMLYFFPANWTHDGIGTSSNKHLSQNDKNFIKRCYPGCSADFSKPTIVRGACTLQTGSGTQFNSMAGNSWLLSQAGESFLEISFNQPKQFEGRNIYSSAILRLVHAADNGTPGSETSVNILLNGTTITENHCPGSERLATENWDLLPYLVDGNNMLRIQLNESARTSYRIQTLDVDCARVLT